MSRQPPFPAHLLPFPPLPDTQALSSSTFKKPPLDGSLTLPEIYDWNYYNNGDHPVLLYPDGEGKLRTIHWSEAVRAVHKAARLVRLAVNGQGQGHARRPIVGILAYLDAISFFVLIVGCMRADCVPFLISPRNPPVAIARLLAATQTTHIMVGVDNALGELASAALELLKQDQMPLPSRSPTPLFEDVFRHDLEETFELLEAVSPDLSSHAVIYHSSGSTDFPKPIPLSHLNVLHCCIVPYFGELDLTGLRLCCHALPMFHGMGFAQTAWTASCGLIFAAAKPQSPAHSPSSENVLRVAMTTASDIVFTVPQHISAWSRNGDELKYLSQIKALVYGGAPLDKGVGDAIVRAGVPLMTFYATMELGATSLFLPRDSGPDWEYFRINPQLRTRFIPNEFGRSELVALTSAHYTPFLVNGKCEDEDANFTNDLFISHPTRAGFWRIYGRTDDQLVTSNAMNTNPGPLENILTQDPSIQAAVIFGNGRSHIGVLVDPHPGHAFDPDDEESLERFREDIWPTIEKMNSVAATYSRLSKKMILSSKPEKPFQYTAKNTVRRQVVIKLYEDEIDALYGVVNMGAK